MGFRAKERFFAVQFTYSWEQGPSYFFVRLTISTITGLGYSVEVSQLKNFSTTFR